MWIFTCEIMWFSYVKCVKVNMWIFKCEFSHVISCEFSHGNINSHMNFHMWIFTCDQMTSHAITWLYIKSHVWIHLEFELKRIVWEWHNFLRVQELESPSLKICFEQRNTNYLIPDVDELLADEETRGLVQSFLRKIFASMFRHLCLPWWFFHKATQMTC